MQRFAATFPLSSTTTVVDVGGTLLNWKLIDSPARLTLVNTDRAHEGEYEDGVTFEVADGRELPYEDGSFDIAFSNSVIEHVGSLEDQRRFAREVRRVGKGLWVQTPAKEFFLEPHLFTPFIHRLSKETQRKLIRNFTVRGWIERPDQQAVDEFLNVRLLTRTDMNDLFPDCEVREEKFLGMTKAYVAVRPMPFRPSRG
jgi:ubiquinone/menaquinone biosynthesis C-methylase UbiE